MDDDIQGTVSLQLENTDLAQLLKAVAKIKQLDLWQENGIYYLSRAADTVEKEAFPEMSSETLQNTSTHYAAEQIATTTIKLQGIFSGYNLLFLCKNL